MTNRIALILLNHNSRRVRIRQEARKLLEKRQFAFHKELKEGCNGGVGKTGHMQRATVITRFFEKLSQWRVGRDRLKWAVRAQEINAIWHKAGVRVRGQ